MGFLLSHLVSEAADRDGAHEAFRFDGAALTYEQLTRRAGQVAGVLADAGVRPGDRVGIYMYKSLELPVALYGILRAGAVYVPIDPATPIPRIRFIVEDCGIRHLLTNASRARRMPELLSAAPTIATVLGGSPLQGIPASCRVVSWDEVAAADLRSPDCRVTEQDLAYIMYTSGSTGIPKGLMHTHASGLSYAKQSATTYGVRSDDRLGNHSPLHFDMSTFEYLTGPCCGATTVIIPEETAMFPVSLGALIERERLTFWYSVPLALIQLVAHGVVDRVDASSLRWVLFGGEPFPPKYLWRLMERWPQARFSNVYGPAEVNQCTYYHVPPEEKGSLEPIPIGVVWENAEGFIADADGEPVPPGEIGELLVRTPTMMQGYWGRPDLNRSAFFEREHVPGFTKRFYRTGDLLRARADGQLVFIGRKDRQVKVRGYRVELDEVENVLNGLEEIAEAAAVVVRDPSGNPEILAAVLLRSGRALSGDDLRRRASGHLPPYAVPARIHVRDTFPRTTSGKIDRRALAEAYQAQQTGSGQRENR
jgi:amino acid adenylation domain-containing protein